MSSKYSDIIRNDSLHNENDSEHIDNVFSGSGLSKGHGKAQPMATHERHIPVRDLSGGTHQKETVDAFMIDKKYRAPEEQLQQQAVMTPAVPHPVRVLQYSQITRQDTEEPSGSKLHAAGMAATFASLNAYLSKFAGKAGDTARSIGLKAKAAMLMAAAVIRDKYDDLNVHMPRNLGGIFKRPTPVKYSAFTGATIGHLRNLGTSTKLSVPTLALIFFFAIAMFNTIGPDFTAPGEEKGIGGRGGGSEEVSSSTRDTSSPAGAAGSTSPRSLPGTKQPAAAAGGGTSPQNGVAVPQSTAASDTLGTPPAGGRGAGSSGSTGTLPSPTPAPTTTTIYQPPPSTPTAPYIPPAPAPTPVPITSPDTSTVIDSTTDTVTEPLSSPLRVTVPKQSVEVQDKSLLSTPETTIGL